MIRMPLAGLAVLLAATAARPAAAQETVPAPLKVGEVAPDFTLPGATKDGLLAEPVRLADLRDQTVVIAFFYRAKTRG